MYYYILINVTKCPKLNTKLIYTQNGLIMMISNSLLKKF